MTDAELHVKYQVTSNMLKTLGDILGATKQRLAQPGMDKDIKLNIQLQNVQHDFTQLKAIVSKLGNEVVARLEESHGIQFKFLKPEPPSSKLHVNGSKP